MESTRYRANGLTSFDLPDDVFEPGETKPTRPKKKVVKKNDLTAAKRAIDALDVSFYGATQQESGDQEPSTATKRQMLVYPVSPPLTWRVNERSI